MTEEILEELRKTNSLLLTLIETIEASQTRRSVVGGKGSKNNLSQDEKDSIDFEIDLEWWFMTYGEESLPAKYMSSTTGVPAPNTNPYTKDEGEYLFNRLGDYLHEENEDGTHVFNYLGKVWCKRESNARNCFAFVPIKEIP